MVPSCRFQAFIIFVGMTTIYFFRPFLPEETSDCTKKAETKWVYFLPSLLDVLGTILDTAGLFYVQGPIPRPACQSAKC